MIPLKDDVRASRRPYVVYVLIAMCLGVFLLQLTQAPQESSNSARESSIELDYGMVPLRFEVDSLPSTVNFEYEVQGPMGPETEYVRITVDAPAVPNWLTILTCIFLHGGWMHLIGNMWFLWIFGDNIEDRTGRFGFVVFYLACGAAASLAHLFASPGSPVPTIGASGAIAGVMGCYLVLYPRAKVLTLVPLFVIMYSMVLPAFLFLGVWFGLQVYQGYSSTGGTGGGVAWWAHVGGFVVGVLAGVLLRMMPHEPETKETFELGRMPGRRVGR